MTQTSSVRKWNCILFLGDQPKHSNFQVFGPPSAFPWQLIQAFPLAQSFNELDLNSSCTARTLRHSARPDTITHSPMRTQLRYLFSLCSEAAAACFAPLSHPDSSFPRTIDLLSCHQHPNVHAAGRKQELFLLFVLKSVVVFCFFFGGGDGDGGLWLLCLKYIFVTHRAFKAKV